MTTDAQKRLEAIASLEDPGQVLRWQRTIWRSAARVNCWRRTKRLNGNHRFLAVYGVAENAVDALKAGREPSLEDLTTSKQKSSCGCRRYCQMISSLREHASVVLQTYCQRQNGKRTEEIKVELIDRFGLLPDPARTCWILPVCASKRRNWGSGSWR